MFIYIDCVVSNYLKIIMEWCTGNINFLGRGLLMAENKHDVHINLEGNILVLFSSFSLKRHKVRNVLKLWDGEIERKRERERKKEIEREIKR